MEKVLKRSTPMETQGSPKKPKDEPAPPAIDINAVMENAKRQIALNKKQLEEMNKTHVPSPSVQTTSSAQSRIEQLKAQIAARATSKQVSISAAIANFTKLNQSTGPTPVILDSDGRTRDAMGREIKLPSYQPQSLANIRQIKQDKFQQITSAVKEEPQDTSFFDSRVVVKPQYRGKKSFRFVEKGKYEQIGEKLRAKAKLEKLQNEISNVAKRTGIQSATTLALIVPKKEFIHGETPSIEWWDNLILESYEQISEAKGITNLVEHPIQLRAPTESTKATVIPIFLTKKERKKLRRQNRREVQRDKMERVRLGLDPAPEPKVKMSNMMRVLGQQQTQDPTKIEAHVRQQMAKRQKAHEETNAARKLTDTQRKEKKTRKLQEDTSLGVQVSLYRILSLTNQSKRFKVEANAKQLQMTGCVLLFRNINLVVVEGGPKQQSKFKKLMLNRIKWSEDMVSKDGSDQGEKIENQCVLVWEGQVKSRSFGEIKVRLVQSEAQARELFKKCSVEQYWDLGYSTTVLALADSL